MIDQGKNLIIGMFVIAACMVLVISLLFLHPKVGDNGHLFRVLFTDVDKITKGTRVTFAGLPVGEVVQIKEISDARDHRKAHDGDVYVYEVILRVDSSVNVFSTDKISARTSGLLGEKNIVIDPAPQNPGEPLRLINNELIYAEQQSTVEDTMKQVGALSATFKETLEIANDALKKLRDQGLWDNISRSAQNISDITTALNKPKELEDIIDDLHLFAAKLPGAWDSVNVSLDNVKKTTDNFVGVSDNFLNMSNNGKELVQKVRDGDGTLGHIIVGNDIYLQIKSLISHGQRVFDDVGQYGLLFHNNKRWQRTNARRLNLMNNLKDPNEFNRYFNNEIEQISSSLSEVSMVLRESERQPNYMQSLMANPEYAERFNELIQRTQSIEESLNMYNTQVLECQD